MRFTPLDKKARAEWREMLNPADGSRLGAAAALFLLSALALPLSRIESAAGLYLLYAVIFYYMLTHSFGALVAVGAPGAVLFGASALATGLPHPYLMTAVYTALVLGGVGGGFLVVQYREKKQLVFLALPVAAYVAAAVIVGPLLALLTLIPTAISLVLGLSMRRCLPQTPVLLTVAAVLAVSGMAAYLVWYGLQGWPAANPFEYLGALVRGGVERLFRDMSALTEGQEIVLMISEVGVRNLGVIVTNALIGFFLAGCGVLAFVIFRVWLRVLVGWGTLSRVPLRIGAMTVSAKAAALFIFSYLGGALAADSVFGAVCENLSIVLQPALVLVGVTSLFAKDKGRQSRLSTVLLIGLLLITFYNLALVVTISAFVGAVRILLAALAAVRAGKKDNK